MQKKVNGFFDFQKGVNFIKPKCKNLYFKTYIAFLLVNFIKAFAQHTPKNDGVFNVLFYNTNIRGANALNNF